MLLDDIRAFMQHDWHTLSAVCAAFPAYDKLEIYALLIDDGYFQCYGQHYQVIW